MTLHIAEPLPPLPGEEVETVTLPQLWADRRAIVAAESGLKLLLRFWQGVYESRENDLLQVCWWQWRRKAVLRDRSWEAIGVVRSLDHLLNAIQYHRNSYVKDPAIRPVEGA